MTDRIVALPEAGEGITLAFTLDAMEALSAEWGEEYIHTAFLKLNLSDPVAIKLCLKHMASSEVDLAALVTEMTLEDLTIRIADAIHLAWKGTPLIVPDEAA